MSRRDASYISSMVNCVAPYSGGSRISPRCGRQLSRGERQHTILPNFPKKLHEIEQNWTPGEGHASKILLCRSVTALCGFFANCGKTWGWRCLEGWCVNGKPCVENAGVDRLFPDGSPTRF